MKNILILLIIAIIILIALAYILIPENIIVSKIIYADIKSTSIIRCLHDDSKWQQWFLGKEKPNGAFIYNGQQYTPGKKEYTSLNVTVTAGTTSYTSLINVIPLDVDSSILQWELHFTTSKNLIKRIEQYQTAKKIKENITALLDSFKTFISSEKNIYGFNIQHTTLTDTTLVSIKTVTKNYPSTTFIYAIINKLQQYIKEQHAVQHNYPMLNITKQKDSNYEVTIGIPTNIPLQGNNIINPKRMIMIKNKTLITEVVGDTGVIKKALQATSDYMNDNQLAPPVIPFQQLVTDRSKEIDSTKWITRIFSPII